ncbi:MAG: helix-turn-helix domain-containing protein [Deltaproteobacteria bacterium]|nr:helix-turn-helix domain-containing protein [Deltaproteobacteria bacterium]
MTTARASILTWLTTADVAAALQVSERSVRRWLARGELAGMRLPGGGWRVSREALDAFTARGCTMADGTTQEEPDEAGVRACRTRCGGSSC